MPHVQRQRKDPRREATRVALIEAAESLMAQVGVDGASTRRIGAAIGSLNTNVVAYHFGSKEALIETIYRYRLPAIDRRRGELLTQADATGVPDIRALMQVMAQPLFEQTDSANRHSFAGFLACVERSGLIATRGLLSEEFPNSEQVIARMAALLPAETAPHLHRRLRLATSLITTALRVIDDDAVSSADAARQFDDAVTMAAAGVVAPPPPSS
jgi:AcrR family transcriptional regulator